MKKVNGDWGAAPSKVAGAAAPDNKPLPEGKGFGVRDREFALLIKKIDFFDKLKPRQKPGFHICIKIIT
ncbi:MAG: hypothetical protein KIG32_05480 [Ruminiclostridium sp.]|nr:hypothetical protein [Ruminiclostridium sp.]